MQYYTADIKKLLKDYNFFKMQIASGVADIDIKEKIEFLENCINVLDEKDRLLITAFYLKKTNRDSLAKELFLGRMTIYRQANKIIERIKIVFDIKFSKNDTK